MTATCRPGMPMVARFLVRSRMRPRVGPVSTWIAASRPPPLAGAPAGAAAAAAAGAALAAAGGAAGGEVSVGLGPGGVVVVGPPAAGAAGALAASAPSALRLVWVSPIALSGAGVGPALAGLRMIMVFSKSAAVAAVGASLKYLSRCLPISTTSLFCRKCFLIGLPFTMVPLVLPRSSMKESFRIVMTAACSPLTARLSIWMSLCGLRPIRVRSLESWYSLSTCPSTLRMSLAIVVFLGYYLPEECLEAREPAARDAVGLDDADQHRRNVVAAAVVVGRLHQLLHRESRILLEREEREADLLVLHHVGESVGAQQESVVGLRLVHMDLGFDRGIDAERARDEVLVLRELRLFRGDEARVELLLEQRMVTRDLLHRFAAQAIQARVADVRHAEEIVEEECHDERRAHAGALRVVLGSRVDRIVGARDLLGDEALGQPLGLVASHAADVARHPRLLQAVGDERRGHSDRDLAGVVSAHSVGEHEQPDVGPRLDAVLIVVPDASRVRKAGRAQGLRKNHAFAPAERRDIASLLPALSPSRFLCACSFIPIPVFLDAITPKSRIYNNLKCFFHKQSRFMADVHDLLGDFWVFDGAHPLGCQPLYYSV